MVLRHLQSSRNFTVLSLRSIISLTLLLHAVTLAVCAAVVESLLFCCSAVHKLVVNLLLLPIRPVTVYSHHSRPCLFPQLNPCHRTSTSIKGSLPARAGASSGSLEMATLIPQTGHSFVGYSDLWKWFICHWHHSCDVAIFIFTPATAVNAQPSTGRPVDGLDRLIAASSMLQPSALTRNDQPFVGQAGPQFQQNLFHRLLVSTSICAIHCLQNCSLKSLSHSFSSTIIWFGHCSQKKCVPKLRTLQAGRSYSSNPFPATLEWFIAIPASHPLHTPACYWLSMDGLR